MNSSRSASRYNDFHLVVNALRVKKESWKKMWKKRNFLPYRIMLSDKFVRTKTHKTAFTRGLKNTIQSCTLYGFRNNETAKKAEGFISHISKRAKQKSIFRAAILISYELRIVIGEIANYAINDKFISSDLVASAFNLQQHNAARL